ncbi:hypothetical protein HanRHA438_Chr08g0335161 [Helianthus annuus]|nr:hypothetical protein HanRHA438_Chr08g0335161 [Helianthus annuus]
MLPETFHQKHGNKRLDVSEYKVCDMTLVSSSFLLINVFKLHLLHFVACATVAEVLDPLVHRVVVQVVVVGAGVVVAVLILAVVEVGSVVLLPFSVLMIGLVQSVSPDVVLTSIGQNG